MLMTASMTQSDADKAIDYIHRVKRTLSPLDYDRFLTIMTAYKSSRQSMQETVSLIQQLFMNHPELNDGFQVFVPSEFRKPHSKSASYPTTLAPIGEEDESMAAGNPWAEESDRSYEQLAVDYVHRVQKTFENDPGKYQEFMDILNSRLSENKSTDEIHEKLKVLLQDYPILLQDLSTFLPTHSHPEMAPNSSTETSTSATGHIVITPDLMADHDDHDSVQTISEPYFIDSRVWNETENALGISMNGQPLGLPKSDSPPDEQTRLLGSPNSADEERYLLQEKKEARARFWYRVGRFFSILGWLSIVSLLLGYVVYYQVSGKPNSKK